jgi:hypothetical protein
LKGWEILCVITITFPPSKNLESYLDEFVKQHHDQKDNKMDVMSQHVSSKLHKICTRGAKGKVLTFAEIERAKVTFILDAVSLPPALSNSTFLLVP